MDINSLLSLRQAWHSFRQNHPKFPDFLRAVKAKGAVPGAEITITVSYPDGETLKAYNSGCRKRQPLRLTKGGDGQC